MKVMNGNNGHDDDCDDDYDGNGRDLVMNHDGEDNEYGDDRYDDENSV